MKIKPLSDCVLIHPVDEEKKTSGGIIIPDTAKEKPMRGKVIAVGKGKLNDNGKRIPMSVKKGDIVLYSKYSGTDIKIEERDYLILNESNIMAVIEE
ncbi:co-chaperone GroES [candidate division KSB1 bacterium]|nr:co-chaperone GroES [candidate division KSB1 bacterium]